ncbi:S26 family signal peptidase [Candidatus Burkholderia verschuerenii]|nr:S26 family signal peptidase [Candidatus Burkholderia verschuerenii]
MALSVRSRRRARLALALLSIGGLAALAWAEFVPATLRPIPRLTYNASESVPVGWYRVDPLDHRTGSATPVPSVNNIVLVSLPTETAALAAQRGYLPAHVRLLKRIAAIAPQAVYIDDHRVRIDGVPVAAVLATDRMGRPLPSWQQCRRLRPGELFLLGTTSPASFDSRYFGPVHVSNVLGMAHPIWLETRR